MIDFWSRSRPFVAVLALGFVAANTLTLPALAQSDAGPADARAPSCDLSGLWRSSRGPMHLITGPAESNRPAVVTKELIVPPETRRADGTIVFGVFAGPHGDGRIEGTHKDGVYRFSWYDAADDSGAAPRGSGAFRVGPSCSSLEGDYRLDDGSSDETPWVARRITAVGDSSAAVEGHPDIAALHAGLDAIKRLADGLDNSDFDLTAAAALLPADPLALRDHVAATTGLAPYYGALRGARGTLMAHAGSPIDRTMLLAALLREKGWPVRFARATIPEAAAAALAARLGEMPVPQHPIDFDLGRGAVDMAALDIKAAELDARSAATQANWTAMIDAAAADGVDLAAVLDTALPPPTTGVDVRATLAAQWLDHVWVQVQVHDAWQNLDPNRVEGLATLTPRTSASLWPDLIHSLTIEIGIERFVDDALENVRVGGWSAELPVIMDAGVPGFAVRIGSENGAPLIDGSAPLETVGPAMGAAMDDYYRQADTFVPTLVLTTGETQVGEPFGRDGTILPSDPSARLARAVGGGLGGASGTLDDLFGGAPATTAAPMVMTAVWVDIGWGGPDAPDRKERRYLMDRIGLAARQAGQVDAAALDATSSEVGLLLSGELEFVAAGGPIAQGLTTQNMIDTLTANASVFEDVARARILQKPISFRLLNDLHRYPGELLALHHGIQDLALRLAPDLPLRQAGPRIVASQTRFWPEGDTKRVVRHGFDLIAPGRMVSLTATGARAHAMQRRFGAILTAYEVAFGKVVEPDICPACTVRPADAVSTLDAAQSESVPLALVSPEDADSQLAALALAPDLAARLRTVAAAGDWIVVPTRPPAGYDSADLGWWRVDPETGATLGYRADGAGGDPFFEKVTLVQAVTTIGGFYMGYAGCTGNWGISHDNRTYQPEVCAGCGLLLAVGGYFVATGTALSVAQGHALFWSTGGVCVMGANWN